jgi:hypothetical protein
MQKKLGKAEARKKTKKMKSKRRGIKISKTTTFFPVVELGSTPNTPTIYKRQRYSLLHGEKKDLEGIAGRKLLLKCFFERKETILKE